MKVDSISPLRTGAVRKGERGRGVGGASFADQIVDEPTASAVTSSAPTSGVQALLALQEVAADGHGRQAPNARGNAVLDQLDQVRTGLLLGFIPREELERLGRLAEGLRDSVVDPRLAEILGEIELRAKVELEKLTQA